MQQTRCDTDKYHRDCSTETTDRETTDKASNGKLLPHMFGCQLDCDADDEDNTFDGHGISTA
jgi:hypothetical protein